MDLLDVNLNLYKSFYYVAKFGGFTNASKNVHISQSSLSSSILKLEELLVLKLFDRDGTKIRLTPYGKDLFSKIEQVIEIMNTDIVKENITIGCVRFIADNYLDAAIVNFKNKFKNIKINVIFAESTDLFHMLKKNEVDLILCRYPRFYRFERNISVEKIKDVENVFVCSNELYSSLIKKSQDVVYPLILPNNSEKRRIIENYLQENGINYQVDIEIPNSDLLKKLILEGVGIGYINKKSVIDLINCGKVKIFDKFENIPLDNVSIIYNLNQKNTIIDDFINILKKTIDSIEN